MAESPDRIAPDGEAADWLRELAGRLAEAGARQEALAEYVPARRRLRVFVRAARMRPVGRVWRLGDYLLTVDGDLLRTGRVVRVAGVDRRRSIVANAITERHELAVAARRGGYAHGETVDFDARPIDLGDLDSAQVADYLTERADLLMHPPRGA